MKSHNQGQAGIQIHRGQGPKPQHLTLAVLHSVIQSFRKRSLTNSYVQDTGDIDLCELVPVLPETKEKAMRTISAGREMARSPGDVRGSNPGFISFLVGDRNVNGSARPWTEFLWNFGLAPFPLNLNPVFLSLIFHLYRPPSLPPGDS